MDVALAFCTYGGGSYWVRTITGARAGNGKVQGRGKLIYGPQERVIDMDDRTLAHVKMVVVSKLRRDESFLMTWVVPLEHGSGRDAVWFSQAIPLQFHFDGNQPPVMNRAWLDVLMESANQGELHVTTDPDRA